MGSSDQLQVNTDGHHGLGSDIVGKCGLVASCQSPVPRFAPTLHVPLDVSAVAMCVCLCVFSGE